MTVEGKPKVFNKYLVTLTKVVAIYSYFYIFLKVFAVFQGGALVPSLILASVFLVLGLIATYTSYYQKYNWPTAILGAIVIIVVRYYEYDWILAMQTKLG